jgi:hypothetical protein
MIKRNQNGSNDPQKGVSGLIKRSGSFLSSRGSRRVRRPLNAKSYRKPSLDQEGVKTLTSARGSSGIIGKYFSRVRSRSKRKMSSSKVKNPKFASFKHNSVKTGLFTRKSDRGLIMVCNGIRNVEEFE